MPKIILVSPANLTVGYSFFTPRWLFVLAQATPSGLVGDPVIVDETIERFDPSIVKPGDIVGIGITSGNCVPGYRVLREAKSRGATVVMGGIHPTIFPEEPLEMGADAVVTGGGDVIWSQVVRDALDGRLARLYKGGRVPGESMVKARWDLMDPSKYMFASMQTVAGCPENCSFCSVWVTDGRQPRMLLTNSIIEEANELYALGFRQVVFADDNFSPATLGRIAREPSIEKRRQFERIRQERLEFFDEYDRRVPADLFSMTQLTAEVATDEEYLVAARNKARLRAVLIGVESFSQEGLEAANKQWNPVGERMVETIRTIQNHGILILSSIITGLETDTPGTIATMSRFARESGTLLAQFTYFSSYPGTKDSYEMMTDFRNREKPGYKPKHRIQVLQDKHWLHPRNAVDNVRHPVMSRQEWFEANRKCWQDFYSVRESIRRLRQEWTRTWPLAGKITYVLACLAFKRVYGGYGIAADGVNRNKVSFLTSFFVRAGVAIYGHFFRNKKVGVRATWKPVRPGIPAPETSTAKNAEVASFEILH